MAEEDVRITPAPDLDLLYEAWTIIANAYEGDWYRAQDEWHQAAERWRDKFHERLAAVDALEPSARSDFPQPTVPVDDVTASASSLQKMVDPYTLSTFSTQADTGTVTNLAAEVVESSPPKSGNLGGFPVSGEDVTGNPLDYESAVAIIVKELRPFTWNARFLAKRVLEGLGVPALLAECEARTKEAETLRAALNEIVEKDTKYRQTKWCSDSQCGDSTWDHDCDEEYERTVGPLGGIANRALGGESV